MRPFPGSVNFFPAVAYLLCLSLHAAFSQPGNGLIEIPCTLPWSKKEETTKSRSCFAQRLKDDDGMGEAPQISATATNDVFICRHAISSVSGLDLEVILIAIF